MPWLAVPFNVDIRRRLRATFKIDRIPSLTPFAPNGMLIEEDAVKLVEDYGIDAFPFDAKRREQLRAIDEAKRQGGKIEELLGCKERDYAISKDGKKVRQLIYLYIKALCYKFLCYVMKREFSYVWLIYAKLNLFLRNIPRFR